MSVIQSEQPEVRYLKRKALEQESKIVGNALRDQIRQYGVDCVYYKLNKKAWTEFKDIVDQNTVLKRAYGYDDNPDYTLSAHMITYAEVQQDIFLLNKIGVNPDTEIDFSFDRIDFACALAQKCGQFKEYKIDDNDVYRKATSQCTTDIMYTCRMLSGIARADISFSEDEFIYEDDLSSRCTAEKTVVCNPYASTSFNVQFPVNSDLYRSLKYKIEDIDNLETLVYLTYKVQKVKQDASAEVNMLSGYVHGAVLFYDIDQMGKYVEMIHPEVGDIVEIDFPDDQNREKYEITDCYDKQLTQDGINPLLHKYIWKCKAKRYINSYEDQAPQSEADNRIEEMHTYQTLVDDEVASKISKYDTLSGDIKEDAAYGGYDSVIDSYDQKAPTVRYDKYDFIDDGTAIDLIRFGAGSRLMTNGYDLIFMNKDREFMNLATNSIPLPSHSCMLEQNLRWLKATDSEVVFVNVEGESHALAIDIIATQGQLELCLNSLFDKTLDTHGVIDDDARLNALENGPLNSNNQDFYKFKGTRTYLWSDGEHLYAKLASNKKLYQLDGCIDELEDA